jgi:hypothetical protein
MMVDPDKIKDIHVLQTIVNGNIIYKKDWSFTNEAYCSITRNYFN